MIFKNRRPEAEKDNQSASGNLFNENDSVAKKIYKWLDNYWYHYKWHTLIFLFIASFLTVTIWQFATKVDEDVILLYGGPYYPTGNEAREITNSFKSVMSEDFNNDGKKTVDMITLQLMTEEQLAKEIERANAEGGVLMYNQSTLNENRTKFSTQIFAGEAVICLLDPNWYDNIKTNGGLLTFEEVLGFRPDNMLDDSSMYLKDTKFAQFFSALNVFPPDTILCVRRMSTATIFKSQSKEEIRYNNQLKMFRDIMTFDAAALK